MRGTMVARRKSAGPTLFAAAGLEHDAPRPLADKLRPRELSEVVGQDHLLGPDGALTRMLETRSLGSLVFWGPPGTGKTTVARLLAQATSLDSTSWWPRCTPSNVPTVTTVSATVGGRSGSVGPPRTITLSPPFA